jgi:hypothetical protein
MFSETQDAGGLFFVEPREQFRRHFLVREVDIRRTKANELIRIRNADNLAAEQDSILERDRRRNLGLRAVIVPWRRGRFPRRRRSFAFRDMQPLQSPFGSIEISFFRVESATLEGGRSLAFTTT